MPTGDAELFSFPASRFLQMAETFTCQWCKHKFHTPAQMRYMLDMISKLPTGYKRAHTER